MSAPKRVPLFRVACFVAVGIAVAAIVLIKGWGNYSHSDAGEPAKPGPGILRVSPAELFTGELKRIEPHLDLTASGCVRLETVESGEIWLWSELEMWKEGEIKWLGSGGSPVRQPREMSFSLREVLSEKGERRYKLVSEQLAERGTGCWIQPGLEVPNFNAEMSGPEVLRKPLELKEGEKAVVWAYIRGQPLKGGYHNSIEEAAKAGKWAIMVRLWWTHPPRPGEEP